MPSYKITQHFSHSWTTYTHKNSPVKESRGRNNTDWKLHFDFHEQVTNLYKQNQVGGERALKRIETNIAEGITWTLFVMQNFRVKSRCLFHWLKQVSRDCTFYETSQMLILEGSYSSLSTGGKLLTLNGEKNLVNGRLGCPRFTSLPRPRAQQTHAHFPFFVEVRIQALCAERMVMHLRWKARIVVR